MELAVLVVLFSYLLNRLVTLLHSLVQVFIKSSVSWSKFGKLKKKNAHSLMWMIMKALAIKADVLKHE